MDAILVSPVALKTGSEATLLAQLGAVPVPRLQTGRAFLFFTASVDWLNSQSYGLTASGAQVSVVNASQY